MGPVEAAWSCFEKCHVKFHPSVPTYIVHLEKEWNIIIWCPSKPNYFCDSPLLRYFERTLRYQILLVLEYIRQSHLLKLVWASLQSQQSSIGWETESRATFSCLDAQQMISSPLQGSNLWLQPIVSCFCSVKFCSSHLWKIFKQEDLWRRKSTRHSVKRFWIWCCISM